MHSSSDNGGGGGGGGESGDQGWNLPSSLLAHIAQLACDRVLLPPLAQRGEHLQCDDHGMHSIEMMKRDSGHQSVSTPSTMLHIVPCSSHSVTSDVPPHTSQERTDNGNTLGLTKRQLEFLQRFDDDDSEDDYDDDDDDEYEEEHQEETREEFEEKKRKLLLLLDQAQMAKLKITRAFPERLAEFGPDVETIRRKYGIHHPAWNEPERYMPDIDCDPYRGACSVSSCPCGLFESWPRQVGTKTTFIYHPDKINPETELCYTCHHAKVDHTLKPGKDRDKVPEFSRENMEKYAIRTAPGMPRRHPADIPWHELKKFYERNPTYPGASEEAVKISLVDIEESKKPASLADVMDTGESYGDDDEDELQL